MMWQGQAQRILLALALMIGCLAQTASSQTIRTDLNLVIAVDCSYSVSSGEFNLQAGGIASAFSDPQVIAAIQQGRRGRIGVTIIQWSTADQQIVALPWTLVSSLNDAIALATRASRMQRLTLEGGTSISGALLKGQVLLQNAPFRPDREVIDVIADGENNNGRRIERVRDELVAQGVTVNALAVHNEVAYLPYYMQNRVIGGLGSFVEIAALYEDFSRAFLRKLLKEIRGPRLTFKEPNRARNPRQSG